MKVYGIKNCDKVKKYLKCLENDSVSFEFIDFKKTPPTPSDIKRWAKVLGKLPLNERSRVFKDIKEDYENSNEGERIKMLCENTSIIKRPLVEEKEKVYFP